MGWGGAVANQGFPSGRQPLGGGGSNLLHAPTPSGKSWIRHCVGLLLPIDKGLEFVRDIFTEFWFD